MAILQLCTALHKKSYLLCCLAIYFLASQFFTVFCPVVLNLCKIMQCTAVSIRPSSIFCRAELYRLSQRMLYHQTYNFVRGVKFLRNFIRIPKLFGWSGQISWRILRADYFFWFYSKAKTIFKFFRLYGALTM